MHLRALEPVNLPRVLAGMGFVRRAGVSARALCRGWSRARSPMPAGWPRSVAGIADPDRAILRAWNRRDLDHWWEVDAARRASPVYRMVRDDPPVEILVDVDAGDGAWTDARGGARGEDLISLGAYMWGCSYGRAANLISRLCGHSELPRVSDLAQH